MKKLVVGFMMLLIFALSGCGNSENIDANDAANTATVGDSIVEAEHLISAVETDYEASAVTEAASSEDSVEEENTPKTDPEIITLDFVDVFGEHYETTINPDVPKHDYTDESFIHDGYKLSYEDANYTSRLGIDVSRHQGKINWEEVKSQGIEFAFIRVGFRGYGKAGNIKIDQRFYENIEEAQKAGIDVGVYFFSQAINEEEALEEAKFVIDSLEGYTLQLPVVYDPESILDDVARTDDVSGEQFTKNTRAFCDSIRENGYEAMIYSNMLWEAFELDLSQLKDIPVWYADYEEFPQTPYHFEFWQYTNEGRVSGIDGDMDFDIQIIRK